MRVWSLLLGLTILGAAEARGRAENWPQWRGPRGNGVASETGIPVRWSRTQNVVWRAPLPGPAGATPIVWEDRIFLTSAAGNDLVLLCFSTEGKELWRRTVGTGNQIARGEEGNSASPSPVTDGRHVWVFFGTGVLACYDFDGNEVWKFNVQQRYGRFDIQFGMTSTPVLHGEHLYLQLLHGSMGGDYIVGKVVKLRKQDGSEVWVRDRPTGAIAENRHSYASPVLSTAGGRPLLITHGQDHTVAFDLETGEEAWRLGGLNGTTELNRKPFDRTLRFVASPVAAEGLVVIPTAKAGPVVAVSLEEARGVLPPRPGQAIRWVNDKTPDVPCPLIVDGLVYLCRQDGKLFVVEAATGEELYYERTHDHQHRASPIYADGHVYLTSRDGHVTVVKAGRTFQIVAENELGETITASPVVSNGTLYLRSFEALYAIRTP